MYQNEATLKLVKSRYKDGIGNPITLTLGQNEIFDTIAGKVHKFVQVICYTRYGKSFTVSLGLLTRASTYAEKWAIVAPSNKKAKIIMGYVIEHIFDNEYTAGKFEIDPRENRDQIRRERSKDRITFRISENRIGEIFILSAEGKRKKDVLDALMGFGAPNIVLDESSLIDDDQYAGIFRMITESFDDYFLLEIGNPFRRNHFFETSKDPDYHHINIDYKQGIKEGRLNPILVPKLQKLKFFSVLYGCKFPGEKQQDDRGWNPLITESELLNAIVDYGKHFGNSKLGVDVAGEGRNDSTIVRRSEGFAEIMLKDDEIDTTSLAAEALALKIELEEPIPISPVSVIIPHIEIAIDKIGVGLGPFQILKKQTDKIRGVVGGGTPNNTITYFNKRAENYWRLREWILAGGKLIKDEDLQDKSNKYGSWKQLLDIKYKINADKKIQIISKDLLREAGIESPDVPDGLANTFETKDIQMKEMKAEGMASAANKKRETHI